MTCSFWPSRIQPSLATHGELWGEGTAVDVGCGLVGRPGGAVRRSWRQVIRGAGNAGTMVGQRPRTLAHHRASVCRSPGRIHTDPGRHDRRDPGDPQWFFSNPDVKMLQLSADIG